MEKEIKEEELGEAEDLEKTPDDGIFNDADDEGNEDLWDDDYASGDNKLDLDLEMGSRGKDSAYSNLEDQL